MPKDGVRVIEFTEGELDQTMIEISYGSRTADMFVRDVIGNTPRQIFMRAGWSIDPKTTFFVDGKGFDPDRRIEEISYRIEAQPPRAPKG
ncbi:MAG: hypothetical protein UZ21_OP11001000793 [Microgenomates bacterium OLB22]|nr:MAG: hypothetical protein UZ21_OP11001000793 [Microgenomates bacterium OLB22]